MSHGTMCHTLQRVMYDPLSYIHPLRCSISSDLISQPSERAAVNEIIIQALQLDSNVAHIDFALNPMMRRILFQWDYLGQVAYLLGCHAKRREFARQGYLLTQPEWVRSFLSVNLSSDIYTGKTDLSYESLLGIGYARLKICMMQLPLPIMQRLPLLFPSYVENTELQHNTEPLIFILALQHAQRYPDKQFSTVSS
ncbi:type III secretion apparatus protein OrgA/MxiK [Salmonella enterica]|nr:type III secretion apparatus protein OrgA/MxiK [Salmonella enterica]